MEQAILKRLVKKELLYSAWLEIDKLVSSSIDLNTTQFGQMITGNHSWYSGALNQGEDIRLSSLIRILAQLEEENITNERVPFESILSEINLRKGVLLNYLTSVKEEDSHLLNIIKENKEVLEDVVEKLIPIYKEKGLGDDKLNEGYKELKKILTDVYGNIKVHSNAA